MSAPPLSSPNTNIRSENYLSKGCLEKIKLLSTNTPGELLEDFDGMSDDEIAALKPLFEKEWAFLSYYFTTRNVRQAVIKAGYKAKSQQTWILV